MAAVLCTGIFTLLKVFLNQRYETYYDDLYGRKEVLFSHKMFHLDYADIDNQEVQGLRSNIRQNENWSSWGLMRTPEHYQQGLTSLFGILSGITLTVSLFTSPVPETSGWLTILNHPVFILVLASCILLVSLLAGHLAGKAVAIWSNMAENATFSNRLFSYFGEFAEKGKRSEDVRLYNQQDLVQYYTKALSDINFGVSGPMAKLARSSMGVYSAAGTALTALLTGCIYVFTCLKAWGGAFDVGSITQYVGAVTALAANIFSLVQLIGQLKANAPYLEQTFTFLNLPNSMYQGSLTTEKRADRQYEVEFQDVSFRYPGASNWSLRHVSLKFTIGSRLAIVGENGSGKTTFIKLLCRLYDPQEGHILLNGIDIRKYKYDDYMDIFSVVFQDFQLLAQPLGANVAGTGTYDKKRVEKALLDAGFKERLASMPEGLDTPLYKDFAENGVEVSGGEAQKIAIARALYKDAPFIILDEPTLLLTLLPKRKFMPVSTKSPETAQPFTSATACPPVNSAMKLWCSMMDRLWKKAPMKNSWHSNMENTHSYGMHRHSIIQKINSCHTKRSLESLTFRYMRFSQPLFDFLIHFPESFHILKICFLTISGIQINLAQFLTLGVNLRILLLAFLQILTGSTDFNRNPLFLTQLHIISILPANLPHPKTVFTSMRSRRFSVSPLKTEITS